METTDSWMLLLIEWTSVIYLVARHNGLLIEEGARMLVMDRLVTHGDYSLMETTDCLETTD